jgi:hypothetical protein
LQDPTTSINPTQSAPRPAHPTPSAARRQPMSTLASASPSLVNQALSSDTTATPTARTTATRSRALVRLLARLESMSAIRLSRDSVLWKEMMPRSERRMPARLMPRTGYPRLLTGSLLRTRERRSVWHAAICSQREVGT